jgi:CDP-diglyceride synthetase
LTTLFSLALLASAVTGSNTPSSVLLVGFGIILLILSVLILCLAIREWMRARFRADT